MRLSSSSSLFAFVIIACPSLIPIAVVSLNVAVGITANHPKKKQQPRTRPFVRKTPSLLSGAPKALAKSSFLLAASTAPSPWQWPDHLKRGWEARVRADPNFAFKSFAEVLLAVAAQLAAECAQQQRESGGGGGEGVARRLLTEIDFVVGGVLTAVAGKYLAMWKVAPSTKTGVASATQLQEPRVFNLTVPTNAFQEFLMDGVTRPTLPQRAGSMVAPVVPLFRAGVAASLVGYGLTAALIATRRRLVPSYVSRTRDIHLMHASLYTGAFMAVVSNLRYQILQGIVEPRIVAVCARIASATSPAPASQRLNLLEGGLRSSLILAVRIANGILGSYLAIAGMRWLGLRRLRT